MSTISIEVDARSAEAFAAATADQRRKLELLLALRLRELTQRPRRSLEDIMDEAARHAAAAGLTAEKLESLLNEQ